MIAGALEVDEVGRVAVDEDVAREQVAVRAGEDRPGAQGVDRERGVAGIEQAERGAAGEAVGAPAEAVARVLEQTRAQLGVRRCVGGEVGPGGGGAREASPGPQGGGDGMLITQGGRFAGYGFYLLKGKPVFTWNLVDLKRVRWEGQEALPPGRHVLEFAFKYDGLGAGTLAFNDFSGLGRPGTGTLKVDGKIVDQKAMPKTLPMILQWDESFDIGSDTLTGVNDADYKPPFPLTAKLNKLTIKVDRPQLSPADIKKLEAATRNNQMSE